jgi:hypothetical protein
MEQSMQFHNIYITSDEQAKEGDWGYIPFEGGNVKLVGKYFADDWKKIILTTDQDLIKDGVQAIDDEFLEWFVKDPSCEYVEVEKQMLCDYCGQEHCDNLRCRGYKDSVWYKIIIPQEEPKQETLDKAADNYSCKCSKIREPRFIALDAFVEGAKWQEERMYSEDALIILLNKFGSSVYGNYTRNQTMEDFTIEWFEQHKKK